MDKGGGAAEVALVTDGDTGVGREIVRSLAAAGLTVYLGTDDVERGRAAAAAMRGDVRVVALDVTDDAEVAAAARRIEDESGRLDVLVNNAGVVVEWGVPTDEISAALLLASYEVNVVGVVEVTSACVPLLRRSRAGRVVNLSSLLGSMTFLADADNPIAQRGLQAYTSSKAAVNAITLVYADALRADGILVDAVSPGRLATGPTAAAQFTRSRTTLAEAAQGPVERALLADAGVGGGDPAPGTGEDPAPASR
ncbi:SDR family NAD(P)-dependent oxidoreductase [Streptomonospora litoralis]|uniref:Cyclopentanol dehydrogenase n=1 Tax=Streptomonospora litoralis TaxID=2498135 RepID=A0A4P6Q7G1_9ACTN|nr:SDR family NAD(P)-dependent oxidoreductase [Streptomonospora litoralis]QBI56643.1 Cyclopentanol dehydrogenase [Streptomonospora litoralis]